jgi:hypothetical protein
MFSLIRSSIPQETSYIVSITHIDEKRALFRAPVENVFAAGVESTASRRDPEIGYVPAYRVKFFSFVLETPGE